MKTKDLLLLAALGAVGYYLWSKHKATPAAAAASSSTNSLSSLFGTGGAGTNLLSSLFGSGSTTTAHTGSAGNGQSQTNPTNVNDNGTDGGADDFGTVPQDNSDGLGDAGSFDNGDD